MLILYALPVSGYCAKVRAVLRLKEISFEERPPLGGSYGSATWREYMPPGSIPAIEDNGFKLFDSEAIVEYLEELVPQPALLPTDPQSRARQRSLSQFHNSRFEPTVRALFPLVKATAAKRNLEYLIAAKNRFEEQLSMLLLVAELTPFIGGTKPGFADCSCPISISMGRDILEWLGLSVELCGPLTDYLKLCEQHPVLGDEIQSNRIAVAAWLNQYQC